MAPSILADEARTMARGRSNDDVGLFDGLTVCHVLLSQLSMGDSLGKHDGDSLELGRVPSQGDRATLVYCKRW